MLPVIRDGAEKPGRGQSGPQVSADGREAGSLPLCGLRAVWVDATRAAGAAGAVVTCTAVLPIPKGTIAFPGAVFQVLFLTQAALPDTVICTASIRRFRSWCSLLAGPQFLRSHAPTYRLFLAMGLSLTVRIAGDVS